MLLADESIPLTFGGDIGGVIVDKGVLSVVGLLTWGIKDEVVSVLFICWILPSLDEFASPENTSWLEDIEVKELGKSGGLFSRSYACDVEAFRPEWTDSKTLQGDISSGNCLEDTSSGWIFGGSKEVVSRKGMKFCSGGPDCIGADRGTAVVGMEGEGWFCDVNAADVLSGA